MKCVEMYSERESATDAKLRLREHGIYAQTVVDPLESIAPALSPYHGVAVMVREDQFASAYAILNERTYKKVS